MVHLIYEEMYMFTTSLWIPVLSYQSVNGRYFAGKQADGGIGIFALGQNARSVSCSCGTACNFIHCFRNPGGDYEWADWDKPPPKYWVKEMTALFGYSDESVHKKTEQGSPRLIRYS